MIILEQHLDRQENSLLIQKGPAQRFSLIRKRNDIILTWIIIIPKILGRTRVSVIHVKL